MKTSELKIVKPQSDLGVMVGSKLKFCPHVTDVVTKAAGL